MLPETQEKANTADMLVAHLLFGKKKHDEQKNVESEEIEHKQQLNQQNKSLQLWMS